MNKNIASSLAEQQFCNRIFVYLLIEPLVMHKILGHTESVTLFRYNGAQEPIHVRDSKKYGVEGSGRRLR